MSLIIKNEYEIPDAGQVVAICCDVIQIPPKEYGPRIKYLFLVGGRKMKDGKPFAVSASFPLKFSPSSYNREFLEDWNGKSFTAQEAKKGFDLEKFALGRFALVTIEITTNEKEQEWPNIKTISPCPKVMEAEAPSMAGYVRMQDRPERQMERQAEAEADQVPF